MTKEHHDNQLLTVVTRATSFINQYSKDNPDVCYTVDREGLKVYIFDNPNDLVKNAPTAEFSIEDKTND